VNAIRSSITGFSSIAANISKANAQIARNTALGLEAAGRHLKASSLKQVPVEFGPLYASAFSIGVGEGYSKKVHVGYGARYAIWVHECVGMKLLGEPRRRRGGGPPPIGKYWDPQPQARARFLMGPAMELSPEIARIVQSFASLGLL